MKRIHKYIIGLALLLSFSNNAFAVNIGYVWIQGAGYYDSINYGRDDWAHIPKFEKTLPDVNSIIRIEAKNIMYFDFNIIQDISAGFISLIDEGKCENVTGEFNNYMLNENKKCSVNKVISTLQKNKYKNFSPFLYSEMKYPIKAKVLGYVTFEAGMFIHIEQTELLEWKNK